MPITFRHLGDNISEHEPRKGTEILCAREPRGKLANAFQNVDPEGGRKPFLISKRSQKIVRISGREPRKGTETRTPHMSSDYDARRFQNVPPERGRKLVQTCRLCYTERVFQNMNPERGRKLKCRKQCREPVAGKFRT